jgi:fumarylacetoacetase
VLPYTVADYVDFYASEQHATNAGRIFRPGAAPLPANWKHLPVGYHGRAGTVVVSGTPVGRPRGLFSSEAGPLEFAPTRRLDFEAEVGFVVGAGSEPGIPIPVEHFADHVFGLTLLNDWSARDIQAFETVPLGPHQGKSFATSVAAWITPLDALERAWRPPPAREIEPPRHLDDRDLPGGLDLELTVSINGVVVSRPPFDTMYWTPAQMLAQLTANGAPARPGDLFGSGTISGPDAYQFGSLLELAWGGTRPIRLGAETRSWLEDGDEVVITASAPGNSGGRIELGEVRGRVCASGG